MAARLIVRAMAAVALAAGSACAAASLDLGGYAEPGGAITVLRGGDTVDPYFALQALLLAHDQGLAAGPLATRWAEWLMKRQLADGRFERFCRAGSEWAACKAADADDALLALWLRLLKTLPPPLAGSAEARRSEAAAQAALDKLYEPRRGIYLVSAAYPHGLLMDNLEVWSWRTAAAADFTRAIEAVFWDAKEQRFLVSTQPEQRNAVPAFYPDAVAQLFPVWIGYPLVPGGAQAWYRRWIAQHRAEWLARVRHDFAWGLVALVAWTQGDRESAACWLRTTREYRHSRRWTVTDEVVAQVLAARGLESQPAPEAC